MVTTNDHDWLDETLVDLGVDEPMCLSLAGKLRPIIAHPGFSLVYFQDQFHELVFNIATRYDGIEDPEMPFRTFYFVTSRTAYELTCCFVRAVIVENKGMMRKELYISALDSIKDMEETISRIYDYDSNHRTKPAEYMTHRETMLRSTRVVAKLMDMHLGEEERYLLQTVQTMISIMVGRIVDFFPSIHQGVHLEGRFLFDHERFHILHNRLLTTASYPLLKKRTSKLPIPLLTPEMMIKEINKYTARQVAASCSSEVLP